MVSDCLIFFDFFLINKVIFFCLEILGGIFKVKLVICKKFNFFCEELFLEEKIWVWIVLEVIILNKKFGLINFLFGWII